MYRTGHLDMIKTINRSLVLETIREHQPISRAEIAKKLGLSRSTVTMIVNELLAKKFVFELGLGGSTRDGGRPGMRLGFNPKSGFGIGVDIGRTKTIVIIADLDGGVMLKEKHGAIAGFDQLVETIRRAISASGVDERLIMGMGIGIPGIVNSVTGELLDVPALPWAPVDFANRLEAQFPFPVMINNDVNFAALGEWWLGCESKFDHLFYIAIGSAVGSAIIANGELVEGGCFSAGEINLLIDREDVRLGRSNVNNPIGVFEQQISGRALEQRTQLPPEVLLGGYGKGNPDADRIVDEFLFLLSVTLANINSLLNPQKIVIGGGVAQSFHHVIDRIRERVKAFTPIPADIELACLGEDAGALGAIGFVFDKLKKADLP